MLNVISLEEALRIAAQEMPLGRKTLTLPPDEAAGLTLAEDIVSCADVPAFDRSTMDGYAVIAADTFGAGQAIPAMLTLRGEVRMGEAADFELRPGECARIPTGGMLPEGADAVIPVEYTDEETGNLTLCYTAVAPWQNVTRRGDDVKRGQTVLQKGTVLSPAAVGVLAAMGICEVSVCAPLKIGVLSTGNELVPIEQTPAPGEVRDVNSHLLLSLGRKWGCDCKSYGILPDEEETLTRALKTACEENDIVLISGGSSAGPADKTAEITEKLGTVFCHGIAVKPGKPTVLGRVGDTAVFGLPGHPAACFFTAALLVKAHVDARTGRTDKTNVVKTKLTEHVSSNHGRAELKCVRLTPEGAVPVHAKSGVISVLSAADGYVIIPREAEGIRAGSEVTVNLF